MDCKQCSKCGIVKPLGEFYKKTSAIDGLTYRCKYCLYIDQKEYKERNKERIQIRDAEYRKQNAKKRRLYNIQWKKTNADKWENYLRRSASVRKEQSALATRMWNQRNRDKKRLQTLEYRARKRQLPNHFTQSDYDYMMRQFGGVCLACGTDENISLDHYIPLSKDNEFGTTPENIIPLCKSCNSSKRDKLPDEWLATFDPANRKRIKKAIDTYFKKVAEWQALPLFAYIREQETP